MKKEFQINDQTRAVDIEAIQQGRFRLLKDGQAIAVEVLHSEQKNGQSLTLLSQGRIWNAHVEINQDGKKTLWANGRRYQISALSSPAALQTQRKDRKTVRGEWMVKAEMPGKVVKILVKNGETAEKSQALLVLEAMKMENEIKAAQGGQIQEVMVQVGQSVEKGQGLLKLFSE